jgi:hypothetical protein
MAGYPIQPFDKMIPGMLEPEMIEDKAKIVNEAIKEKGQVNIIINSHAGGNARLVSVLNSPEELKN